VRATSASAFKLLQAVLAAERELMVHWSNPDHRDAVDLLMNQPGLQPAALNNTIRSTHIANALTDLQTAKRMSSEECALTVRSMHICVDEHATSMTRTAEEQQSAIIWYPWHCSCAMHLND
jgi:hypothetical protein